MLILKELNNMLGSSTIIDDKVFFSMIKKRDKVKRAFYTRGAGTGIVNVDLYDKKVAVKQKHILIYDNPSTPNLVLHLFCLKEIEDRGNNSAYTIWFSDNSYLFLLLA